MFPYFTLFGRVIGLYPIMALCGVFAAGIYVCSVCKKEGRDDNDGILFLLVAAIGVFIGGHLLYALVNFQEIVALANGVRDVSWGYAVHSLMNVFGGSVFYGGLIGGMAAGFMYLKKHREKSYLVDIAAPAIPLFHFFGRIGCFLGGCCFGIESVFGFTFHDAIVEEANGVNRFPVQLLEAMFNLCLFAFLDCLRRKRVCNDKLLYAYLLLYSVGRFFIEFIRGDEYRGRLFFLSTSQIISIALFGLAMVAMGAGVRRRGG
jgi:phosphatidylglycerol:prolipoprotein diacylglycerol transferase